MEKDIRMEEEDNQEETMEIEFNTYCRKRKLEEIH